MFPTSKEHERSRRRGKGLTNRQIKRRSGITDSTMMSVKHEQDLIGKKNKLLSFGKSSAIYGNNGNILIDINRVDLPSITVSELQHALEIAKSPIPKFVKDLNEGDGKHNLAITKGAGHKMIHFGIWMNNVSHYSGGRVHLTLMAYALAEMGHKVTIITDRLPRFLDDLKYIEVEDRIEYVYGEKMYKTNWLLNTDANNIQLAIATPRIYEAFYYARKWNIPCYAFLLETPNHVSKFRGGQDSTEMYWKEYKDCIKNTADFILCNPGPTIDAAKEWLPNFGGTFFECPPPINVSAADKVDSIEENEVCFVGRHLDFKCPDDVIKAVSRIKSSIRPTINFIGSHNDQVRQRLLDKATPEGVELKFYAGVNDYEKFQLIKRSKVLIAPTKFEGFGMPPAEALYCKKPVIVYELPVLRHVYGNNLIYVKPGDIKGLANKLEVLLENPEKRLKLGVTGFKELYSLSSNIPCLPHKIKNNLRNIFYGKKNTQNSKITVGIIVLNGADTLRLCLDSIYEFAEKIIIVEGAVEDYAKHNKGLVSKRKDTLCDSIDNTFDLISEYIYVKDHLKKIEVVFPPKDRYWLNKNEMQNEIAKRVETPLYLKVDSDEIWKKSDIEYCRRIFMDDPKLTVMYMRRWHFWKDFKTVAVGGQWDSAEARMWRWNDGFHHTLDDKKGFNYFVDSDEHPVVDPAYKAIRILQRMHYHLGYCRKYEHIAGKIKYYANRGIEQNVKDNFTNWKSGDPTNSTHPNGTTAIPFKGKLPFVLQKNYHKNLVVSPKESTQNNMGMLNSRGKE